MPKKHKALSTSKLRSGYNRGRNADKPKKTKSKADSVKVIRKKILAQVGKPVAIKPADKKPADIKKQKTASKHPRNKIAKPAATSKPTKPVKAKPAPAIAKVNTAKGLRRLKLNLYQKKYDYAKQLAEGKINQKKYDSVLKSIEQSKIDIDTAFGISSGFNAEGKYQRKKCLVKTDVTTTKTVKGKKVKTTKTKVVLTDEYKRADRALYAKVYRRKKKIKELAQQGGKKKKGFKAKRSRLYAEIKYINDERRNLREECDLEVRERPERKRTRRDIEAQIEYKSQFVWQFEKVLTNYIVSKEFRYVVIGNKRFDIKKDSPLKILMAYDDARDMSYMRPLATTPIVNYTLDFGLDTLTIEIES